MCVLQSYDESTFEKITIFFRFDLNIFLEKGNIAVNGDKEASFGSDPSVQTLDGKLKTTYIMIEIYSYRIIWQNMFVI